MKKIIEKIHGMMSMEDLRAINKAAVKRLNELHLDKCEDLRTNFNVGDEVEWVSGKKGGLKMGGKIIRKNIKTATVATLHNGTWNVAWVFLTKKT